MYTFHPIVKSNYLAVQRWLTENHNVTPYRTNSARNKVNTALHEQTLESAFLQFYVYFGAHAAKVGHTLEELIGFNRLAEWLSYKAEVVAIDVGCGGGAASVAFANCLLKLCQTERTLPPLSVHYIGIDPNENAIAIYHRQLDQLSPQVKPLGIHLSHRIIAESDLQAVSRLREYLAERRRLLNKPFLSQVFLFQSNVVSPFSKRFQENESKRLRMIQFGIPEESLGDPKEHFGSEEAIAYKQIMEDASIDNLHVITVGTDGFEEKVAELAQAIDLEFQGNNHVVNRLTGGPQTVEYEVLDGSYWKQFKGNDHWTSHFHVEVSSICSVALADEDWQNVTSDQNLLTAWARARHHLMEQPLVDEVEIRLFESRLDDNLARLQKQLVSYAQEVVHSDDRLHFKFPKSADKFRPLGLSRIEEEILSTALIQKLGQRLSGIASRSYAYKFARNYGVQNTEYLYEPWFDAYKRYIEEAQAAARAAVGCVVVQMDIKSFYTRILRDFLAQLSAKQLSRSARVEWLLKLLFSRDLDEHEAGKGIVQGNLASGFFANLYLVDLDARLGPNNEWKAKFFRFVDDMIIVIPDEEDAPRVIVAIEVELAKLGLEPNLEKTQYFSDATEFIEATGQDEKLDLLDTRFREWIICLGRGDVSHRHSFRKAYRGSQDEWWYRVDLYRLCLKEIDVIIDSSYLSRRLHKYLFNEKRCKKDFSWAKPFEIPQLPETENQGQLDEWRTAFESSNKDWMNERNLLFQALEDLILESAREIRRAISRQDSKSEKRWATRYRFCLNRLMQIGLHSPNLAKNIADCLVENPWLFKDPGRLTENLAIRGHSQLIESLLSSYNDETDPMQEYMKAVLLRSVGFLAEVPLSLWKQVAISTVSDSSVTSLMATETWLRVVQRSPQLVEKDQLQRIEFAVQRTPRPVSRLLKNYFLILGDQSLSVVDTDSRDDIFTDVVEVIRADSLDYLFERHEPAILVQEYYSGASLDIDSYYPV